MKKFIVFILVALPVFGLSQVGVKAGVNFANVTKASSINNESRSGFHVGLFLAPPSQGIMGYQTEVIFSRQGYNYKTGTTTGDVALDYIMLPQYMTINISKYFSIQFGGQMAFLLNAKADSSNQSGGTANPYGELMDYYNKFDYGYGGGIEVHPISGLVIGARFNISLSKLYDPESFSSGTPPSFIPDVDVKNNLFQIFAGWKFGKQSTSNKKKEEK